jgi:hypothetical protein
LRVGQPGVRVAGDRRPGELLIDRVRWVCSNRTNERTNERTNACVVRLFRIKRMIDSKQRARGDHARDPPAKHQYMM